MPKKITATSALVVITYLFPGSHVSLAQSFCKDLKEVLRAGDENYLQIRGKFTHLPSRMISRSEGWISTKTISGFDMCAIGDNIYGCLGADQLDGDDELTSKYSEVSNSISACLPVKVGSDRGWRVSQIHKFTGSTWQMWTNRGNFDKQGRETRITLSIYRNGSLGDLSKLGFSIRRE